MREADIAKERLLAIQGDPLLHVEWHQVLFLNYLLDPKILRPHIPRAFELDLYRGEACISLVRVIMRNYRRAPNAPRWGAIFRTLKEQRFLNFRTYVRRTDEPGAFFMWGWLSRPLGLPLPDQPAGLTCAFADFSEGCISSKHGGAFACTSAALECGGLTPLWISKVHGAAESEGSSHRTPHSEMNVAPCAPGSVAEFALERYSGFFAQRDANYVFRAWHEPWLVKPVNMQISDLSLITNRFPWFKVARFIGATYAPLSNPVWLGRAHRLSEHHHRSRPFLEMP